MITKLIHIQSKRFVEAHGINYCGNTTICCLVNPMSVVACPTERGYSKMRTCAIYPVCKVEWNEEFIIEPKWSDIETASKNYNKNSKIDLENFIFSEFEDKNPKFINLNKQELFHRLIINI